MRKLIVSTYATLDGRVDDLPEWTIPFDAEAAVRYHSELLRHSDGLVLGRRTYEIFAVLWPAYAGRTDYADRINALPKHVASRTLRDLTWENSHLIEGDAAAGVAALKDRPGGDLVVYGCRGLTRTLLEHGLVDEYRVLLHPVLLGKGPALVPDGLPAQRLELAATEVIAKRVVVLTYHPAA